MKIVLDFDDFSVLRHKMDLLIPLKEAYPGLRVSMFTIPYDYEYEMTDLRLQRDKALKMVRENLDWIQIIPHGLTHQPGEFLNCDKETMYLTLKAIDEFFKKDGLPYVNGFKAPYWQWNQDVVDVLDEMGWWGAIDPNQEMLKTKKYYQYSHSIDTPFWQSDEKLLKLHGHMTLPSSNNLEDCMLNLMKMPRNAKFYYATDFLEE
jgi:hypothetical protein